MKYNLLTCLLILISCCLFGQSNDTWIAFDNKDSSLIGFKDKNGIIKIEPKFSDNTIRAKKFDNVIAIMELTNHTWQTYYLTKAGKVFGNDSLETSDNSPDCESEGFIRFRVSKTDKAGMFNRNGKIVIPAMYNWLSPVRNSMVHGLKGAKKKYVDKDDEHPSWEGGKEVLIDTNNRVLIDSFKYDYNEKLNYYSLIISSKPDMDSTRINFKSTDGKNYSFVVFEKEFKTWLKLNLLDNFTKDNLIKVTFREVTYWQKSRRWIHEPKESFIDRNYELIKEKLFEINSTKYEHNIFIEGLNPFTYNSTEFQDYYNNCGESKDWIYPILDVRINYWNKKDLSQDSFQFLRTDNGYKLISIGFGEGEIK